MLIQSFENQSNLAEFFEHIDHYSVVITRHKDNKRTKYKLQKIEYVYSMLKVKGSVTALVNCAKDLAVTFSYIPPTVNTDNKQPPMMGHSAVGVVNSEGEVLLTSHDVTPVCPRPPETNSSAPSESVLVDGGNPFTERDDYPNHPKYENLPRADCLYKVNNKDCWVKNTMCDYPNHPKYENLPLDDDIPPAFGLGI